MTQFSAHIAAVKHWLLSFFTVGMWRLFVACQTSWGGRETLLGWHHNLFYPSTTVNICITPNSALFLNVENDIVNHSRSNTPFDCLAKSQTRNSNWRTENDTSKTILTKKNILQLFMLFYNPLGSFKYKDSSSLAVRYFNSNSYQYLYSWNFNLLIWVDNWYNV